MNVEQGIEKLTELHSLHGVVWTLGSGELRKTKYGGIAYSPKTKYDFWKDADNWIYENSLTVTLENMIDMVEGKV